MQRLLLLSFVLAACGDGEKAAVPDAGVDAPGRMCSESITYTTVNRPPCKWEWTCVDGTEVVPYAADCVAGDGQNVVCQCSQAGAQLQTMTLADGCFTITDACQAANAACGFSKPITCPQ